MAGSPLPVGSTRLKRTRSPARQVGGLVASIAIFPPTLMTVYSSPISGMEMSSGCSLEPGHDVDLIGPGWCGHAIAQSTSSAL